MRTEQTPPRAGQPATRLMTAAGGQLRPERGKEETIKKITWNDKPGSRGRAAHLLFVTAEGEIIPFRGATIPGAVVVLGTTYKKDGKWSNTTFRLGHRDDLRPVSFRDGWEIGTLAEGIASASHQTTDSWADIASALGSTEDAAKAFFAETRPKEAARISEMEEACRLL